MRNLSNIQGYKRRKQFASYAQRLRRLIEADAPAFLLCYTMVSMIVIAHGGAFSALVWQARYLAALALNYRRQSLFYFWHARVMRRSPREIDARMMAKAEKV